MPRYYFPVVNCFPNDLSTPILFGERRPFISYLRVDVIKNKDAAFKAIMRSNMVHRHLNRLRRINRTNNCTLENVYRFQCYRITKRSKRQVRRGVMISSRQSAFLCQQRVNQTRGTFPFRSKLNVRFNAKKGSTYKIRLCLVGCPICVRLFRPRAKRNNVIITYHLPKYRLSDRGVICHLVRVAYFYSSLYIPRIPECKYNLYENYIHSFSQYPIERQDYHPDNNENEPHHAHILSNANKEDSIPIRDLHRD